MKTRGEAQNYVSCGNLTIICLPLNVYTRKSLVLQNPPSSFSFSCHLRYPQSRRGRRRGCCCRRGNSTFLPVHPVSKIRQVLLPKSKYRQHLKLSKGKQPRQERQAQLLPISLPNACRSRSPPVRWGRVSSYRPALPSSMSGSKSFTISHDMHS